MFEEKVSQKEFDKLARKFQQTESRLRSLCELLGVAFTPDYFDEGIAVYMKKDK